MSARDRARGISRLAAAGALVALLGLPAGAARTEPVECWRGWGYWIDRGTGAYASDELLLVTRGPAVWRDGEPVRLYQLDRASGAIDRARPAITALPRAPRVRYRGRSNYVDGRAEVPGAEHDLVFGLSQVAPPAAALDKLAEYNRWACGLAG